MKLEGYGPRGPQGGGGIRGTINGYSSAARRRCRQFLASINWERIEQNGDVVVLLTLTVHRDDGPRSAKRALKVFHERAVREFGPRAWFWRMEPQKRGAPHFHLLLVADGDQVGVRGFAREWDTWLAWFNQWALRAWRDCTGQSTITQVRAEFPRSRTGAMRYLSKYVSKACDLPATWEGHRLWGSWGEWPQETRLFRLGRSEAWQLRRWARNAVRAFTRLAVRAGATAKTRGRERWRGRRGSFVALLSEATAQRWVRYLGAADCGWRDGSPLSDPPPAVHDRRERLRAFLQRGRVAG